MSERRDDALGSAMHVEQLADSLSQAADTLHASVMRAIRKRASLGQAGITQAEAQAVFALEVALRQQANTLHEDASGHAITGLDTAQRELNELLGTVRQRIARHDSASHWIGLATGLLNLGRAVLARSPERILSTLATVRERLQQLAGE